MIKNINHFFALIIAFCFLAMGCTEEPELNSGEFSEISIDYSGIEVLSKSAENGRGSSESLLAFNNLSIYEKTILDLERQVEMLDDQFISTYSHLSEDEMIDKEEEIGFDENKPLLDFAERLGFSSLYEKIAKDEEEWLNNEEIDFSKDPDDHFVFDEAMRAVLNQSGDIKIGVPIYKIVEDGYYAISDGKIESLNALDSYLEAPESGRVSLPKNVTFHGNEDHTNARSSSCRSWKRESDVKDNSSKNKRIKYVVSHWSYPWGTRVAAKTKNYKKRRRRWRKYRTSCLAQVYGSVSGGSGNCSSSVSFNDGGAYAYQSRKKKVKHKINVSTNTKSGWVKGYHSGAGGVYYYSKLTW